MFLAARVGRVSSIGLVCALVCDGADARAQDVIVVDAEIGDDAGLGTQTSPFQSLGKAFGAAVDGDTIRLQGNAAFAGGVDFGGVSVTLEGAGMGATTIDCGGLSRCLVIESGEGPGIIVRNLTVTGDAALIDLDGVSDLRIESVELVGHASGPAIRMNACSDIEVVHSVLHHGQQGISADRSSNLVVRHNVIRDHSGAGIFVKRTDSEYTHNVFMENEGFAIERDRNANPTIRYNDFFANTPSDWFNNRSGETRDVDAINSKATGKGNLALDPGFADLSAGAEDYHLLSAGGRFDPVTQGFVSDAAQSPLVDAGDPEADTGLESEPDGDRVNIGLYGSTTQASRTYAGPTWHVAAAGGDDSNPGSAALPFASIQRAIGAAEDGDTVQLGAGTFFEGSIELRGKAITVRGLGMGRTIVDTDGAGAGFRLIDGEGDGTRLEEMTLRGGARVVFLRGAEGPVLRHLELMDGGEFTLLRLESGSSARLERCAVHSGNEGIVVVDASSVEIEHCVFEGLNNHGLRVDDGSAEVRHSIFTNTGFRGVRVNNSSEVSLDYNLFWETGGGPYGSDEGSLSIERLSEEGIGEGNLELDPHFASTGTAKDYHLRSNFGRFDPESQSFVVDTEHSGAIDRGDPEAELGGESAPNRSRINIGLYGGTAEASRSYGGDVTFVDPEGSDAASGAQAFPLRTLGQAVRLSYPGQDIRVAAGTYAESKILIAHNLAITGAGIGNTVLRIGDSRGLIFAPGLDESTVVKRLTLSGDEELLFFDGDQTPRLEDFELRDFHGGNAAQIRNDASPRFTRCVVHRGQQGINATDGAEPEIERCVIRDVQAHGLRANNGAEPRLRHSIIADTGSRGVRALNGGAPTLTFNLFSNTGAGPFRNDEGNFNLAQLNALERATGNIEGPASFVRTEGESWDYHLQSNFGRFDAESGGFVVDARHSAAIDAGDPEQDAGSESEPNGDRVNIGLYGGGAEASRSYEGNEWTVSPEGSDAASGAPGFPLRTIARALASARAGGIVRLDTGSYLERKLRIDKALRLIGAGMGESIVGSTENGRTLELSGDLDEGTRIEGLTIVGASESLLVSGGNEGSVIRWVELRGHGNGAGLKITEGASPRVEHCLVHHGRNGILVLDGGTPEISHCVMQDLEQHGLEARGGHPSLRNSIIANTGARGVRVAQGGSAELLYNLFDQSGPGPYGSDEGPLNIDALNASEAHQGNREAPAFFASLESGSEDYHLRSNFGRFSPEGGGFVIDEEHARGIDAGNPDSPVGEEAEPNFDRVNIGLYGGTSEASLSYEARVWHVHPDGNDNASGAPAHPFHTLAFAVDFAAAGDRIEVQAGRHLQPATVKIEKDLHIRGAGPGLSILDFGELERGLAYRPGLGEGSLLEGLTLTGERQMLFVTESQGLVFRNFELRDWGTFAGMRVQNGAAVTLSHCVLHHGVRGLNVVEGAEAEVSHCVVRDMSEHGLRVEDGELSVRNSIVAQTEQFGVRALNALTQLRHNLFFAPGKDPMKLDDERLDLAELNDQESNTGNIEGDPRFHDLSAGAEDYHLQSTGGRFDPPSGQFVADAVDSPAIDAGDPESSIGEETEPNGGVVNIGRYGATAEASRAQGLQAPTLIAPDDLSFTADPVTFDWEAVAAPGEDPVRYTLSLRLNLQGDFDTGGADQSVDHADLEASEFAAGFLDEGVWSWRVQARAGGLLGRPSPVRSFTVGFNDPPVAAHVSGSGIEGGILSVLLSATDSDSVDPEGFSFRVIDAPSRIAGGEGVSIGPVSFVAGTFTATASYLHDDSDTTADAFTYVASDGEADSAIVSASLSITAVNDPPTADAGGPYEVDEGQRLVLSGSGDDPDGPNVALRFEWDFDHDPLAGFDVDATGPAPQLDAADGPAQRNIALRVVDPGGLTALSSTTVDIANLAPSASAGGDYEVGLGFSIQLAGNASDPAGDADPLTLEWDFDFDGQSFEVDATGATPTFDAAGLPGAELRTVALRARDDDGGISAISSAQLEVIETDPPIADAGGPYQVDEAGLLALSGSATDPDGDDAQLVLEWDLDYDGVQFNPLATGLAPLFDAAAIDGPRQLTIALRARDPFGAVSTVDTAQLDVRNVLPVADAGGPYVVNAGAALPLAGSASDVAGDADPLTLEWDFDFDGQSFAVDATGAAAVFSAAGLSGPETRSLGLRARDDDGGVSAVATSELRINAAPQADAGEPYTVLEGGAVQLQGGASDADSSGPFTFEWDLDWDGVSFDLDATGPRPSLSAAGIDGPGELTVALRVRDTDGAQSELATQRVSVDNAAPSADAGGPYRVNAGDTVTLDGSASDPAGPLDTLSFEWDFDYDGQSFEVDAAGQRPDFSAAGLAGQAVVAIALRVRDEDGGVSPISQSAVSVNVPPENPSAGGPYTVSEGGNVALSGSASDPDGDDAALNLEWDFDYDGQVFEVNATGPSPTFSAAGLDGPGGRTLALRAIDPVGAKSPIATTPLTVENAAPTADAGGDYVVNAGDTLRLAGSASDPAGAADALTLSWDLSYDGVTFNNEASGPEPLFDATALSDAQVITIALQAKDDDGALSAIDTAQLRINVAPTADAGGFYAAPEGGSVILVGRGEAHPDSAPFTFHWDTDYDGGAFDINATGEQLLLLAENFDGPRRLNIGLRVTDRFGARSPVDSARLWVRNVAPEGQAGGPYQVEPGQSVVLQGAGSDAAGPRDPLSFTWDFDYTGASGDFIDHFAGGAELQVAAGLAFGPLGDLFVASRDQGVLHYSGVGGGFLGAVALAGQDGLEDPIALGFGLDANLFVADAAGAVVVYDGLDGGFLRRIDAGLTAASALSFGPGGALYVADSAAASVLRYDPRTGALLDTFVAPGEGGLVHPNDLAFDAAGDLYVASANHRILRYDGSSGAFVETFVPAFSGGLVGPRALSFGPDGQLYVLTSDHNLLRFDGASGAFDELFVLAGEGGMDAPTALRFGPDQELYVNNSSPPSVLRFDGDGFDIDATGQFPTFDASAIGQTQSRQLALRVRDNDGALSVIRQTALAIDGSAQAEDVTGGGNEGQQIQVTLRATDPDSDDPTRFDFEVVDPPQHISGAVSIGATVLSNGVFQAVASYQHDGSETRDDAFTYQASDGSSVSNLAFASLSIAAVNDAPRAVADSFNTPEDQPLIVASPGVLGNDPDPDSPTLTAALQSDVNNGTLTFLADGSFRYEPDEDFSGTDSFSYIASDGELVSDAALVSIAVVSTNDPPRADTQFVSTVAGAPVDLVLSGTDLETPTDALRYTIVQLPQKGVLSEGGDVITVVPAALVGRSLRFTPAPNETGLDDFAFTVTDWGAGNQGPVTSPPATVSVQVLPRSGVLFDQDTYLFQVFPDKDAIALPITLRNNGVVDYEVIALDADLPAGSSLRARFDALLPLTVPAGQTHTLNLELDTTAAVLPRYDFALTLRNGAGTPLQEDGAGIIVFITDTPLPELALYSVDIGAEPFQPEHEEPTRLSAVLRNLTEVPAENVTVSFLAEDILLQDERVLGEVLVPRIEAFAALEVAVEGVQFSLDVPGARLDSKVFRVDVIADDAGSVNELDESNNEASIFLQVGQGIGGTTTIDIRPLAEPFGPGVPRDGGLYLLLGGAPISVTFEAVYVVEINGQTSEQPVKGANVAIKLFDIAGPQPVLLRQDGSVALNRPSALYTTDDGHISYTFPAPEPDLPPGRFAIQVDVTDHTLVATTDPDRNLEFGVVNTGWRGRVYHLCDETELSGGAVRLQRCGGGGVRNTTTNAEGFYELIALLPGCYRASIDFPASSRFYDTTSPDTVVDDSIVEVDLPVLSKRRVSGQIFSKADRDALPVPVAGATVILRRQGGGQWVVTTDQNGAYQRELLPSGVYTAEASYAGHRRNFFDLDPYPEAPGDPPPEIPELSEATLIDVPDCLDATNIDITLRPVPTGSAMGTVVLKCEPEGGGNVVVQVDAIPQTAGALDPTPVDLVLSPNAQGQYAGEYELQPLTGNASYVFRADSADYAREFFQERVDRGDVLQVPPGQKLEDVDFSLDRGARVQGEVLDCATGLPVQAPATVTLSAEGHAPQTTTSAAGTFAFDESARLWSGEWTLSVGGPGYLPRSYGGIELSACNDTPTPLGAYEVARFDESIVGSVEDCLTDLGVEGATVEVWESASAQRWRRVSETTTDAAGDYVLRFVPPGSYRLVFRAPGYYGAHESCSSNECSRSLEVIVPYCGPLVLPAEPLEPFGRIRGEVRRADDNQTMPDVSVLLIGVDSGREWPARTDENGEFDFSGLRSERYLLRASAFGFLTEFWMDLTAPDDEPETLALHRELADRIDLDNCEDNDEVGFVLRLQPIPVGAIRGKVVSDAGLGDSEPIAGVIVRAAHYNGGVGSEEATTDASGDFIIRDLPASPVGRPYRVYADPLGVQTQVFFGEYYDDADYGRATQVPVFPAETTALTTIRLETTGSAAGRIVDCSDDSGLGDALIELRAVDASRPDLSVRSGAGGDFDFPQVRSGFYDLFARQSGFVTAGPTRVLVAQGDELDLGDLELGRAGAIRGEVRDSATGEALVAVVTLHDDTGAILDAQQSSPVNGGYAFAGLVDGDYRVCARIAGEYFEACHDGQAQPVVPQPLLAADPVEVDGCAANPIFDDIDFALSRIPLSAIVGQVWEVDPSDPPNLRPAAGVEVILEDFLTEGRSAAGRSNDDAAQNVRVDVAPGVYRVAFAKSGARLRYYRGEHGGEDCGTDDRSQALAVVVEAGQTVTMCRVVLVPVQDGVVRGAVRGGGLGLAGATIALESTTGGLRFETQSSGIAEALGEFVFPEVIPGSYIASAVRPGFGRQWFNRRSSAAQATVIVIGDGEIREDIDFDLVPDQDVRIDSVDIQFDGEAIVPNVLTLTGIFHTSGTGEIPFVPVTVWDTYGPETIEITDGGVNLLGSVTAGSDITVTREWQLLAEGWHIIEFFAGDKDVSDNRNPIDAPYLDIDPSNNAATRLIQVGERTPELNVDLLQPAPLTVLGPCDVVNVEAEVVFNNALVGRDDLVSLLLEVVQLEGGVESQLGIFDMRDVETASTFTFPLDVSELGAYSDGNAVLRVRAQVRIPNPDFDPDNPQDTDNPEFLEKFNFTERAIFLRDDEEAPQIAFSWAPDFCADAAFQGVISVSDPNFESGSATLSTAGGEVAQIALSAGDNAFAVDGEGEYQVDAVATDCAQNETRESTPLILDYTPPQFAADDRGEPIRALYSDGESLFPSCDVEELHLVTPPAIALLKDGAPVPDFVCDGSFEVKTVGDYELVASGARDCAGHEMAPFSLPFQLKLGGIDLVDGQTSTDEDLPVAFNLEALLVDHDGSGLSWGIVRELGGSTTQTSAGSADVEFTPAPNQNDDTGEGFWFEVQATDGVATSNVARVTVTVAPVNDAPVTIDGHASGLEDGSIDVPLAPLSSDIDSVIQSYRVASPVNGQVSLVGDGSVARFVPDANLNSSDGHVFSFLFAARDAARESNESKVLLDIGAVNDPPETAPIEAETDEDSAVDIDLLVHTTDIDSAALDFQIQGVVGGTAALLPDGHTVRYTPAPNQNSDIGGPFRFAYRASDGEALSGLSPVNITVRAINDPPVAVPQQRETLEDTPVDIVLAGTDPDGDALSFVIVEGPAHGRLVGDAPNLRYEPDENFAGADQFRFTVKDAVLTSDPAQVDITVVPVNDPPEVEDAQLQTLEDTAVHLDLSTLLHDPDGPGLRFELFDVQGGSAALLPDGVTVSFTPAANANDDIAGPFGYGFRAHDTLLPSNDGRVDVSVTPVNDPPTALAQQVATDEDTPLDITLAGEDVDGDPLSYTVVGGPSSGALTGDAPALTYTPAAEFSGPDAFSFTVSDGQATSDPAVVDITVRDVNDAPIADSQRIETEQNIPVNITLTGRDVEGDPLTFQVVTPPRGELAGDAPNLVYTPPRGFNGEDRFTFIVHDGNTASAPATVTIVVKPSAACTLTGAPAPNPRAPAPRLAPVQVTPDVPGSSRVLARGTCSNGFADTQRVVVNWGDGSDCTAHQGAGAFQLSHTYAPDAVATVRIWCCDGTDPVRCDDVARFYYGRVDFLECSHLKTPCLDARYDAFAGLCVTTAQPDGTPCDDGRSCTIGESCSQGVCQGAEPDDDNDGVGACNDCDDALAGAAPGLAEVCDDGIDNDCDGQVDDLDSDCGAVRALELRLWLQGRLLPGGRSRLDRVNVELHTDSDVFSLPDLALEADGRVLAPLGPAMIGDATVVVRHLNHLAIASAATIALPDAGTQVVDLTDESQVAGSKSLVCDGEGRCAMRAGDIDGDGVIGDADYVIMSRHWGRRDPQADLDGDGRVFLSDHRLWQSNYRQRSAAP